MEKHILILEDSPSCQVIAKESLKQLGRIKIAKSCQEARDFLQKSTYDLILIDMSLPDGNGFEFFGELRRGSQNAQIPVVFATADEDVSKKVAAFAIGASDYVTKPYSSLELRARVERIFRSSENDEIMHDSETGLIINTFSYKVSREFNGEREQIILTPNEFKLLLLFLKNPERIYSRNQILNIIWGEGVFITERAVDTHVSSLRKKLKHLGDCIVSVRALGYSWRHAGRTGNAA